MRRPRSPIIPWYACTSKASGHVFYAKTHDHRHHGRRRQEAPIPVSTNFDVTSGMETGASTLEVVANGIPSRS